MTKPFVDYYALLGLSPDVPIEEIVERYQFFVQVYHPDSSYASVAAHANHATHAKESAERLQLLQQAYQVLTDPEKRAEYDKKYHLWAITQRVQHTERPKMRIRKYSVRIDGPACLCGTTYTIPSTNIVHKIYPGLPHQAEEFVATIHDVAYYIQVSYALPEGWTLERYHLHKTVYVPRFWQSDSKQLVIKTPFGETFLKTIRVRERIFSKPVNIQIKQLGMPLRVPDHIRQQYTPPLPDEAIQYIERGDCVLHLIPRPDMVDMADTIQVS